MYLHDELKSERLLFDSIINHVLYTNMVSTHVLTPSTWLKLATICGERRHGPKGMNTTNFETTELRDELDDKHIVTLRNNVPHSNVDYYTGETRPAYMWDDGAREWYVNGYVHRDPDNGIDQPAFVYDSCNSLEWISKDQNFRNPIDGIDQPAFVVSNGHQVWYRNCKYHRDPVDGVEQYAVLHTDGSRGYHVNGKRHRSPINEIDQPALVETDGTLWWYQNGIQYRESIDGVKQSTIVKPVQYTLSWCFRMTNIITQRGSHE